MNFLAYINGEFIETTNQLEVINPTNNQVAGTVSALVEKDIDFAFESASKASGDWKAKSLESRKQFILKFNDLLLKNKEEIAHVMNAEIAKPIQEAIVEIERTSKYIIDTIKSWDNIHSTKIVIGKKTGNINRVPLGVVLAISPFNYPINLSLAKIIPALLIGNSIVFKPATNGSLTGAFLGKLFHEANFPKGIINIVTGRGKDIGDLLTSHKKIAMITFTGGVKVGRKIAQTQNMIPLVLELGGNDLAYVRHDANLTSAAAEIAKGAFSYAGQRCTAIKRLLIHKDIKDKFIPLLLNEIAKIENNPLVSSSAADHVEELIEDSKSRGDKFLLSGKRQGNVVAFHVIETNQDSRVWLEEAFGPVLPISYIETEEDLVNIINSTEYGLQNSLFTSDVDWAKEIALSIESGTVNINCSSSRGPDVFPFSGIKNSGFGVQGIEQALLSMSRIINVVEND